MEHRRYMQLALGLAAKGWPRALPNPMVGCVIVHNHLVVAEGYHENFGGPHAEVNAVRQLPSGIDPSECTVYVTLEPCSHHGKTPPCAELLVSKKFGKVVIASRDPNPLVAGKGIAQLKSAGIEVVTGILEKEADELNKRFMVFHREKRPYIILKWAISADGFVSRLPVPAERAQNLITRKEVQQYVHRLRSQVQGILVGKNTALYDNPELTTRLVSGPNPVRILIDRQLEVPLGFKIFNGQAPTFVFNEMKEETRSRIQYRKVGFQEDLLPGILKILHSENIQSLLVEGGTATLNSFIRRGLWDEICVFQNPDLKLGGGLKGPEFPLKNTFELVGEDKFFHHFKNETSAEGSFVREVF